MKIWLITVSSFFFLFSGCLISPNNHDNSTSDSKKLKTEFKKKYRDCLKEIKIGNNPKKLCLPKIEGMHECYSLPEVKILADGTENPNNTIFAYYINDRNYKSITTLQDSLIGDYFKIFTNNNFINVKTNEEDLDKIQEIFLGVLDRKWENIDAEINRFTDSIKFDVPTLLKSYSPFQKARSGVLLTRMRLEEKELITISIFNILVLNDNLFILAFYYEYKDSGSIKTAIGKNDYIVSRILNINN